MRTSNRRRSDCKYYSECLDISAKRNWKWASCTGCYRFPSGTAPQSEIYPGKASDAAIRAIRIEFRADHGADVETLNRIENLSTKWNSSLELAAKRMLAIFLMKRDPGYYEFIRSFNRKNSPTK